MSNVFDEESVAPYTNVAPSTDKALGGLGRAATLKSDCEQKRK